MGRTSGARERLVAEAGRLFHVRGYESVGVQELCDAAGLNKGSFYHFFASKEDLAGAVIEDQFALLGAEIFEPALADDIAPLARIERLFEQLARAQREGRKEFGVTPGCLFANLAGELCGHAPKLRRKLARAFTGMRDALEATLREAVAAGELPRGTDTEGAAEALLALAEGALLMTAAHDDPALARRVGRLALGLVGAGGR